MLRLLIITSLLAGSGCNDQPRNTSVTKSPDALRAELTGCYMEVIGRDTFAASLQQQGELVTGKLSHDNFEKDATSGPVSGKLTGDILRLVYRFNSEGTSSVTELCFKYQNGKLLRGVGDMKVRGDSAWFSDPEHLKFNGTGLLKFPCEVLPDKYKVLP